MNKPFTRKLAEEEVQQIRILHAEQREHVYRASTLTIAQLANKFGVGYGTVYDVVKGVTWRWLPWPKEAREVFARIPIRTPTRTR